MDLVFQKVFQYRNKRKKRKKRPSFYDDYLEGSNQNKKETGFSLNRPALKVTDLTPNKIKSVSQISKSTGSLIKNNIKSVLSQKYGELDTRNLFDGIDDKDIEDNIQTAENTIKTNLDRGVLSKTALPKLPNLRDGLALSYAAANKGNNRAATRAREAAYTEQKMTMDFDGVYGLQCVDFSNWFLDNYTTLGRVGGNGKDIVGNLANSKKTVSGNHNI